jgi:hypothetical protein
MSRTAFTNTKSSRERKIPIMNTRIKTTVVDPIVSDRVG